MRQVTCRAFICIVLFLVASASFAITYIVPSDRHLVQRAEAIVIATAVESHAQFNEGGGIVTVSTLDIKRVLKGPASAETIQLAHPGGSVGLSSSIFAGSPRFENGKRYLLFLDKKAGAWQSYGWGLGKFEFVTDLHGRELLLRGSATDDIFGVNEGDWTPHAEPLRGAPEFVRFVEGVVESATTIVRADYVVPRSEVVLASFGEFRPKPDFSIAPLVTRPDYMLAGNYRWATPSATFVYCCGTTPQPGFDGPGAAASAVANWTGAGAGINYSIGARDDTANSAASADGKNSIIFNDPHNEVPSGAAAIGGINNISGSYTLSDGITYLNTSEADVVVAKTSNMSPLPNAATFIGLLTHEFGHTLGFRHSDGTADPSSPQNGQNCALPLPCAGVGAAVMAHIVNANMSALGQWDSDAANTVYGSGPQCTPPRLSSATATPSTITSGGSSQLSAAATGSAPLTFQWYIGTPGTTTTPAGPAGATISVSPTTTTTYWVRVTGQCAPPADSTAVTVTVQAAQCTVPSNVVAAANPASIAAGNSSNLTASASGTTPITFQWFTGNPPNGTNTGQTGASISVTPGSTTTYYAHGTNSCGSADSNTVTVTVTGCVNAQITQQPFANPSTVTAGQNSSINVGASGTGLSYQWFVGTSPNTANPLNGATNSTLQAIGLTQTTSYWVRVTGQCGPPIDSNTVTITVVAACVPPSSPVATANPLTITAGQSSTLTASANGTGLTFQWFTGTPPSAGTPISNATSPTLLVTPTATTSYFARITGQCGNPSQVDTNVVTIVVSAACIPPSITTQPSNEEIVFNDTATLSVVAAGTTPLTYQWFRGASGDATNPQPGATSSTFTTPNLTAKTQYWVRVTGQCGTPVNSNTATVEPTTPRHRAAKH